MKNFIVNICCLLLGCCSFCFAQDAISHDSIENKKNNIQHTLFLELWGSSSGVYNITYDCLFPLAKKHKIALATGIEYIPFETNRVFSVWTRVGVSIQVNYLYGKKNNYLEVGTGINFPELFRPMPNYKPNGTEWEFRPFYYAIPFRIGYRYQKAEGGFFWKIGIVEFFTNEIRYFSTLWGGVAVGYTFIK